MSSDHDRNILLRTISGLPNAIDCRVHNQNNLAFKMEELVMSQNKTIIAQTADEISKAVQENLKLSKVQATTGGNNQDAQTAIPVVNLSAPVDDSGFATEHATLLSNMLKSGKSDEALTYLNKFTQNAQTKEAEKIALSEAVASTSTVNNPDMEKLGTQGKHLAQAVFGGATFYYPRIYYNKQGSVEDIRTPISQIGGKTAFNRVCLYAIGK